MFRDRPLRKLLQIIQKWHVTTTDFGRSCQAPKRVATIFSWPYVVAIVFSSDKSILLCCLHRWKKILQQCLAGQHIAPNRFEASQKESFLVHFWPKNAFFRECPWAQSAEIASNRIIILFPALQRIWAGYKNVWCPRDAPERQKVIRVKSDNLLFFELKSFSVASQSTLASMCWSHNICRSSNNIMKAIGPILRSTDLRKSRFDAPSPFFHISKIRQFL